jgi:hypothetical protein
MIEKNSDKLWHLETLVSLNAFDITTPVIVSQKTFGIINILHIGIDMEMSLMSAFK